MEDKYKYNGKVLKLEPLLKQDAVAESEYKLPVHKCLYCYESLANKDADYHETCNKKFFGVAQTPYFDYDANSLKDLAARIVNARMAVTGVQAKLSLNLDRKENERNVKKLTIVGMYGDYILKPQSVYYEQLPELEHLTMRLATLCSISVVPHTLYRLKDKSLCYITKRIDRVKGKKIHMEDLCQLSNRLTEDKYKGSYEQVAKKIAAHTEQGLLNVINFFEQLLFCYLTGNSDMHLKNFSLIMQANGKYNLCPAYDLLATCLVNKADKEELALTLNGKKSNLKYRDFAFAFEQYGINKKVLDNLVTKWYLKRGLMRQTIDNSFLSTNLQFEFKELLDARYRALLLA
jgi:serine/threonine-protein kinase HipA